MRLWPLAGAALLLINVCWAANGTTTGRRRGRPPTKTTQQSSKAPSSTTQQDHKATVATHAVTEATHKVTKATHEVTKASHEVKTTNKDGDDEDFDYGEPTEFSETKLPRRPPRTFGPVIGPDITAKDIEDKLRESRIIPDILNTSPKHLVEVTYQKRRSVLLGNLYSCLQVDNPPVHMEWPCEEDAYYTVILTDPDAPIPDDPYQREFHHWIVGNIPGCHVRGGVTLSEYITPLPITLAGTHRYVFLVYKQDKGLMKFDWEHRDNKPIDALRADFNSEEFAKNYSMSGPVAINYFKANWETTMTPLPGDEAWLTTKDFYERNHYPEY